MRQTVVSWPRSGNPAPDRKVTKTDAEWRKQLSAEAFLVTRKTGTVEQYAGTLSPCDYTSCSGSPTWRARRPHASNTAW